MELVSDLYFSILEFQDAIWAYWGPFALATRPEIFGGKTLDERAEFVYSRAQAIRLKYFRCHLKLPKESLQEVESLVKAISDAKLNFDFPSKRTLTEFWITKQFQSSYTAIDIALESLAKMRVN